MVQARSWSAETRSASPLFFSKQRHAAAPGAYLASSIQPRLLACVDESSGGAAVLPHAMAVGGALGLDVTLGRVIEPPQLRSPADPIEWKLRCDRHRKRLAELADPIQADGSCASVLLAGRAADEISIWGRENGASVLALARRASTTRPSLGSTAQRLLEQGNASLLLVSASDQPSPSPVRYRRILVPIDGSARSESVLPVAARIARTHDAELLLAHVVPRLQIVDEGRAPQLRELRGKIDAHNERNARGHLDSLRAKLASSGYSARILIAGPGDPRTLLRQMIAEQHADLVVLSSHGRTGLSDVACGSVAEYLAAHALVPLLLVRPNLVCRFRESGPEVKNEIGVPVV